MGAPTAEHEVAAALRGERPAIEDPGAFASAAVRHGVASLLVRVAADAIPLAARDRLLGETRRHAAVWAIRDRELRRIASAVAAARLDLLVVKGAHLAYTAYPDPSCRECVDVDLFVRDAHHSQLVQLLGDLGYAASAENVGDAALGQAIFDRPGVPGTALDVHSRLFTPPALARHLDFDTLWRGSAAVSALGGLRVPNDEDALVLTALHQAVHHPGRPPLRWLYDAYLLLAGMSDTTARRVAGRLAAAAAGGMAVTLIEAQRVFPTPAGAIVASRLPEFTGRTQMDAHPVRRLLRDVRALPSWRQRLRLVRGHLLPGAEYMRRTYAPGDRRPLALLYLLRIARGARKRK